MLVRHYVMTAVEGQADGLRTALNDLAGTVRTLAGCIGVEVLSDTEHDGRFVFIERWMSPEQYKAASTTLPKSAMAPVMAALAGRPEACFLSPALAD